MKVKAKHWINANGNWYKPGETFEVDTVIGFENAVEVVAEEPKVVEPVKEEPEKGNPEPEQVTKTTGTRRGRKSST